MMDRDTAEKTASEVFSRWSLARPGDTCRAHQISERNIWIGYCGEFAGVPFSAEMRCGESAPHHVSVIKETDTLYIVSIFANPLWRGKGHGQELYELCETLAVELGCFKIQQTPSGGYGKRSRLDYLLDRGWRKADGRGIEVFKPLSRESC